MFRLIRTYLLSKCEVALLSLETEIFLDLHNSRFHKNENNLLFVPHLDVRIPNFHPSFFIPCIFCSFKNVFMIAVSLKTS